MVILPDQRKAAQHFVRDNDAETPEIQGNFRPYISVKFFRIFSPVCWLFSGWN